jgi:hypothetical protein
MKIGVLILIAISIDSCTGCNPIEPTTYEPDIEQESELMLIHPVRQTYTNMASEITLLLNKGV